MALSINPGGVATDVIINLATKHFGWLGRSFAKIFLKTPSDGALTTVFAAAAPVVKQEPERYGGAFLVPYGKIGTLLKEVTPSMAKDLWRTSENILREMGVL